MMLATTTFLPTVVALLSRAPASPVLSLYLKLSSGMYLHFPSELEPTSPHSTPFTTRQWRLTGVLSSKIPVGLGQEPSTSHVRMRER
ncbi:hypothetical protein PpBr36_08553 [Pyricularia pennisetigena]|uniref:hypothetical protein n=1 Tax=Pyricularia pennisetigena TaxID=1578925 RepID=UPI0011505891|nr:hypothetical protein PpBr36_08553 [Pyricularia pennisetigena]TLS24940.1 hypothetical protein PpBr36_08553 [Pyricularia pennisetigena]